MHDRVCRLLVLCLMVTVTACGTDGGSADAPSTNAKQLDIATTVAPITSIVANIVGDRATITGIVPEGTNSHTFEPKPSVAELLVDGRRRLRQRPPARGADQGAGRGEPRRTAPRSSSSATRSIPESEYIYDFSFPKAGGKPNPHLWTDPPLALRYAEIVRDDLSRRDPANAALLRGQLRRVRGHDRRARRGDARRRSPRSRAPSASC